VLTALGGSQPPPPLPSKNELIAARAALREAY